MAQDQSKRVGAVGFVFVAVAASVLMSADARAAMPCDRVTAMPAEAVNALVRDPAALLRRHADADNGLAEEAQATMASGLPGRFALLAAARQGSFAQQDQIGRGIGRAYRACLQTSKSAAGEILDGMLRSDVPRLNAAFQAEVEALWTRNSKAQLPEDRPTDAIGASPADVFSGSMPDTNLTAGAGPLGLPTLSGPLPDPFAPIR